MIMPEKSCTRAAMLCWLRLGLIIVLLQISSSVGAQSPFEVSTGTFFDQIERTSAEVAEEFAEDLEDFFANPFGDKAGEDSSLRQAYNKWIQSLNEVKPGKRVNPFQKLWFVLTYWHFEGRMRRNDGHPSYEEVLASENGWRLLPPSQSIFHDNGFGDPELKYIHSDGREAVFTRDFTGSYEPYFDPRYVATYNYVSVGQKPKPVYNLLGWASFVGRGVGHIVADVIPYKMLGGNVRKHDLEAAMPIIERLDNQQRTVQ